MILKTKNAIINKLTMDVYMRYVFKYCVLGFVITVPFTTWTLFLSTFVFVLSDNSSVTHGPIAVRY